MIAAPTPISPAWDPYRALGKEVLMLSGGLMEPSKVDQIWNRMNDSERFGVQFGLFPSWIEEYNPTHEDHVALMERTKEDK